MKTAKEIRTILHENFGSNDDKGHVTNHRKEGEWTVRRGYFYKHGRSEEDLEKDIRKLFRIQVVDKGDHWATFKGSEGVRKNSYFWVRFKVLQYKPISSLWELKKRCESGDEYCQELCCRALTNIGCEHLAEPYDGWPSKGGKPKPELTWEDYYHGLMQYWMSMVGGYGMDEEEAEIRLVDEINFVGEF